MVFAGIVTYNPDISRLNENISNIKRQVDRVILYDNASENLEEIKSFCTDNIILLDNVSKQNNGIAFALNELCKYSISYGCKWLLTLDQDSVCPQNLISEYSKYISLPMTGILTPKISDRNIGDIEEHPVYDINEIDVCITSASFINLSAWKSVGGFWNDLFIDMVDFDICWSLKEHGYSTIRVNTVSLIHELGHSTLAIFRGQKVPILNHSPIRYYYIFRNTIAVGKKHNKRYQCFRWNCKRAYLILRYESSKVCKIRAILLGVFDGLMNNLGPANKRFL